ncbi:cation transporter [Flavobacteriaceae bacterium S0825]|uniref:heavy-metal-associated domain-containing protein n=1 Tax=Gaetbulibacter sp. S0825 TaxID=2720084 RepID=UPI00142F5F5F|nr:heavy metal-associated domain-containing protein [Gaetbulibacter sp. S0825]MCK0107993.1 cation transporter [Flavobacteriaceae bacterium S0825]NIX63629.1 heavy-metal-associated domain-containing protein [Gaetbulibacter sp. S0825]
MKTFKNILALVMVMALIISCKNETSPEVKTIEADIAVKTEKVLNLDANFVKSEFTIEGMTCEIGCAKLIEKNINKMDGVKSAKVDFNNKLAMVEYDEAMVNHTSLEETVTKSADVYKVSEMKTVKEFSAKKDKECDENCTMACCKDKTEVEKKECAENCTKACCAEKKGKA